MQYFYTFCDVCGSRYKDKLKRKNYLFFIETILVSLDIYGFYFLDQ